MMWENFIFNFFVFLSLLTEGIEASIFIPWTVVFTRSSSIPSDGIRMIDTAIRPANAFHDTWRVCDMKRTAVDGMDDERV